MGSPPQLVPEEFIVIYSETHARLDISRAQAAI